MSSSTRSLLLISALLASGHSVAAEEQRQRSSLRAASVIGEDVHRSLKSAAQKAAKEAAGTHYYEIKAKTTKAVPDSGLNTAVSTESDAEVSEAVELSLDADFDKKEDKRESRKADKKAREEAESTGASVHTWNGETRRGLAGSPTKSPSSGLHKPTWKPSSKPNEHRQLSNAHPGDLTTSTAGKGAFAEVGPSKSPSTGIHKPTWKPTQGKPSGKPVEPWKEGVESAHTEMKNSAHTDGEIEKEHSKRELKGADADPCHDGLSPRCTPPTSKPVEHRSLAGSPTKSPSSGLHKPTWKPSSKPAEHRSLKSAAQKAAKEAAGTHYYEIKAKTTKAVPDSGLNTAVSDAEVAETEAVEVSLDADFDKKEDKRESRKADKKAREEAESTGATVHTWSGETRRGLAGSPTKSPSSGLHKPTWKPSSKPNEHRKLNSFTDAMGKLAFWRHGTTTSTPSTSVEENVMTTTASDVKFDLPDEPTGVPPNHKDSEPMYPTVVDIPLNEPSNANAPSAEKGGSENVLPSSSTAKATPPVAAVAHTAPVTTVPLMTTTASDVKFPIDTERTGLAPDHRDSEPMYPTVVNVPFVEANNANGPSSAKTGNEDRLPVTTNKIDQVITTGDKVKVTDVTSTPSINDVIIAANEKKVKVTTTTTGAKVDTQTTSSTGKVVNSINAVIEAANATPIKPAASSSSSNNKMMSSGNYPRSHTILNVIRIYTYPRILTNTPFIPPLSFHSQASL